LFEIESLYSASIRNVNFTASNPERDAIFRSWPRAWIEANIDDGSSFDMATPGHPRFPNKRIHQEYSENEGYIVHASLAALEAAPRTSLTGQSL
jgi:hypothetical protein